MKKSFIGVGMVALLTLTSCGGSKGLEAIEKSNLKIGMVCIGDPDTSTYDANFKNGLDAAATELGLEASQVVYAKAKGEGEDAHQAAEDLIDDGCNVIIADSYGHQEWAINVAKKHPNVRVVSCTGDTAAKNNLPNFYNAFANIYEGRYLAGIAAGMKLNSIIQGTSKSPVMGYVAAWPFAEVISGYTAFYLGAKSVCPNVTMKYKVTSSWGDAELEKSAANSLIEAGALIVSQHADTYGAPGACELKGVPNVSYNVSTKDQCPNTFLAYSRINWTPYFKYLLNNAMENKATAHDWSGGAADGSIVTDDIGTCAVAGTEEAINNAKAALAAGTLHVFDTSKFTVGGQKVTTCEKEFADGKKECIVTEGENSYFAESVFRSAPYFDLAIDGISELTAK